MSLMRKTSLALTMISLVAFHSRAAEPEVLVTKDMARNAIASFARIRFRRADARRVKWSGDSPRKTTA